MEQIQIYHFPNPLMADVPRCIETSQLICNSQLICIANQLSGFFMMENIGR